MRYKLLAVDMDGTLLNNKRRITDKTIEAVQAAAKMGVLFVISTGRPVQGVEKYSQLLGLTAPVILYNGAMIVVSDTKEVIYNKGLSEKDIEKIFALGQSVNTTMCVWSNNQLYGNVINDKINEYKKLSGVEPILITDYQQIIRQGITKILWYDAPAEIQRWQDTMLRDAFSNVTYCTSKPEFLEFFNSQVSKAKALEIIGKQYDIKPEEMIAVGDGYNDLSMLQYAGLGIVMENAPEGLKELIPNVTASNEEDGVARVIERYFLSHKEL